MAENRPANKPAKGEFEEFKSAWMLQVAADRGAKAAAPITMVLACQYLNRGSGKAWPSINSLKEATGAASSNTIRSALKLLEERGHAHIEWSDGGKNKTHVVTPLANGKPFRNLKGVEAAEPFNNLKGSHEANPSTFGTETLQVSDAKPFKKLNPNYLSEPLDLQGAAQAAPRQGRENNSDSEEPAFAYASRSPIGEEEERFFAGDAPSFDGREDFAAGDPPTADEAHSFFAKAFEALCASGDDPSFADQNTTADAALVEHRRTILRCRRDDDGLSPTERDLLKQWQQKLDDGASLTIAEVDELQNIANFLDLSDDADADDAGWPRQNSNSSQKETVR